MVKRKEIFTYVSCSVLPLCSRPFFTPPFLFALYRCIDWSSCASDLFLILWYLVRLDRRLYPSQITMAPNGETGLHRLSTERLSWASIVQEKMIICIYSSTGNGMIWPNGKIFILVDRRFFSIWMGKTQPMPSIRCIAAKPFNVYHDWSRRRHRLKFEIHYRTLKQHLRHNLSDNCDSV